GHRAGIPRRAGTAQPGTAAQVPAGARTRRVGGIAGRTVPGHDRQAVNLDTDSLVRALRAARARTLALVADLHGEQWLGPQLDIVNPPLWELGHVGWFQEYWVLREACGREPLLDGADALYDSARVHHGTRWSLPLPSPGSTRGYLERVLAESLEVIAAKPFRPCRVGYFAALVPYH